MTDPVGDSQVWDEIRREAARDAAVEPALAGFLHEAILRHSSLESSLGTLLAGKLDGHGLSAMSLRDLNAQAFEGDPGIGAAVIADLQAVLTRDPATRG